MFHILATSIQLPDVIQFLNYGILGVVVVLLLLRKLVPGQFWQEERDARIASDNYVKDTLIPLVQKMTDNQERANELLVAIQKEREGELAAYRAERARSTHTKTPAGG